MEDVLSVIFKHFSLKQLVKMKCVNKLFNTLSENEIKLINQGDNDPNISFDLLTFDMDEFIYPIRSLLENEGEWDINSIPLVKEPSDEQKMKISDLYLIDKAYFYQYGEHDEQSWLLIGKVNDIYGKVNNLYYSLEASCDYTGFGCQGGGSLHYYDDWKTLWNHLEDSTRRLMLKYYGYHSFVIKKI